MMTDGEALIQAFVEEAVRRKKAETIAQNVIAENERLVTEIAELKKAAMPLEAKDGPA